MIELSDILKGKVEIIKDGLKKASIENQLLQMIWESFDSIPSERVKKLKEIGLESMHKILTFEEIVQSNIKVNDIFNKVCHTLTQQLVVDALEYKQPIWCMKHCVVRFIPPYDFVHNKKRNKNTGSGRIYGLGPHKDSWFHSATNQINIWVPLVDVRRGMSFSIFPQHLNKDFDHVGPLINNKYFMGQPTTFEMNVGDFLVFWAEHLHASELNISDKTRVVATFRFTMGKPAFPKDQDGNHTYYLSKYFNTKLENVATSPGVLTRQWTKLDRLKKSLIRKFS